MGYKPTLGGLKVFRDQLYLSGFPMPEFYVDVYDEKTFVDDRWWPKGGKKVSLERAIECHGPTHQMADVLLANPESQQYIVFSSIQWVSEQMRNTAYYNGFDVIADIPQSEPDDNELWDFLHSEMSDDLFKIAQYGISNPTRFERFLFYFFTKWYARRVLGYRCR